MYAPLMTSVIATVASMSQPNVLAIAAIIDAFGIFGQLLINSVHVDMESVADHGSSNGGERHYRAR